ncbi:hypothetical protein BCR33DRAFT_717460 [Rhizoclosmatium globosum]|uniref:Uncharacterized protein n=1 Tax=Rhizoclosmatium globosum TaxID=329046 RepID=A0A1Y2C9W1_9FUNG|nr:hypothetical protein BCR33DRAFT_717460 [Rhizoclosmatium globosum]|eukprot:ORY43823.1 hypothetical protein BCR33DRAFT_717460 [Rhizoclosmatium globosum]
MTGNYIADSNRIFNSRGQRIYDAISGLLGTFFFLLMLIYAGFRGHKVVTQLPATYRTTQTPNLIPIDYFDDLFPSAVPSASFEFPVVTMCADDPAASVAVANCIKKLLLRTLTVTKQELEGDSLSCVSVNQAPGNLLIANDQDEYMYLQVNVTGTRANKNDGILTFLSDQNNATFGNQFNITFDNYFTAATYTTAEVAIRKVITIDLDGNYQINFESKVTWNSSAASPVNLEIRYPALQVVYEKAFLPLDMFNWLGEVGGVASLLFFIHSTVIYIVPLVLLRFDRYTDVRAKRPNNYESFNNY